ncbi:MAG: M23 family metallopeptidase, partial [Myxococcaceae bacterium]|nr:M23 family metallopeptidase [Myxococcaceae bacterium]
MRLVSILVLACACATPQKMTWSEAMRPAATKPSLSSDPVFEAELRAFIDAAQQARRAAQGGAMPAAQAAAWQKLLGDVDVFLARRPVSLMDLARARMVVEGELELDGSAYGDIDAKTAGAAQATVQRLTVRLDELMQVKRRPKVTPRHFAWPVSPVMVSSPFGERVHPLSGEWRQHRGVDVVAERGQPVRAAFSGTVMFAGWHGAHGKTVHVVHDARWSTRYSHLDLWEVEPGEVVKKGQVLGYVGSTGQSTGPHLHFEV